jgi:hypothetical protein
MLIYANCRVTDSKYYKSGSFLGAFGHKKTRPGVAERVSATLVAEQTTLVAEQTTLAAEQTTLAAEQTTLAAEQAA